MVHAALGRGGRPESRHEQEARRGNACSWNVVCSDCTTEIDLPDHVLIVEDDPDQADSLALLLQLALPDDALVDVASGGRQAVSMALATRPKAVVMDLGMPGMSGFEAATSIREIFGAAAPILIAVSGSDGGIAAARAERVFDHAILKPVDLDRLLQLLGSSAASR